MNIALVSMDESNETTDDQSFSMSLVSSCPLNQSNGIFAELLC